MPKLSQEVDQELRSDICSTHTSTAVDKVMQTHHPCNRDNDIFCCATNKTICVGPGIDEGNNRDTIERFIKDVSFHEDRYLSMEGIEAAFLASKFIIEVQRTFEQRTQCRYFVPSIIYKFKYVEINPRDVFCSNPLSHRHDHIYMFVKCWEERHKKKWVARRVSIIGKPQFSKYTKVYKESRGQWFISGLVENWGRVFHADDE